ncbi:MAG: DUF6160 family protein [Desulfatibacillaceae bacterium]
MKKGLLIIVLAALLALPMSAMAGMWSITENEMEDVTGQAGITIDMAVQVTSGYVAYGDDDGDDGGTYASAGFFTLSGMKINDGAATPGALDLSGLTIDVGTNASSESALVIGLPSISGQVSFDDILLGDSANGGTSLGSLTLGDLGTAESTITITAH